MKVKSIYPFTILFIISSMLLTSFTFFTPYQEKANPLSSGDAIPDGPVLITGEFEYTNEFVVETYYVEHAVALLDMTGFVKRDFEWEMPVEGQVLGYMHLDAENNRATFRLALPAVPEGELNDVDQDTKVDTGLQVFAVGYNPNLTGDVFSDGDDRSLGWPSYLASVKIDTENESEVTGGKLVIWALDDSQQFPSAFGDDGLLFTQDDPIMDIPDGYSIVDLDTKPFTLIRDREINLTLYEPEDIAVKDFSALSYSQAFEKMFAIASKEYAFNGVDGKQPDWDAVYAEIAPRVAEAEKAGDAYSYFLALRDFSMKFNDGHVSVSGGDLEGAYNETTVLGGVGFAVRELDNGRVIVVYVQPDGPADQAGMPVGAELVKYNGQAVADAISNVKPFSPQSTDFGRRTEQTVFLTRGPIGQTVTVEFINPSSSTSSGNESANEGLWERIKTFFANLFGGKDQTNKSQTAELTSVYELDSLFAVYMGGDDYDENVLPVEYHFDASTSIGYVRINSNYDDLGLAVRIFQRAMQTFEDNSAMGIIIDMRRNIGGSPLGLAGFLYNKEIPIAQLEYYSEKTGKFEPEGPIEKFYPNEEQFTFNKMALLVDQYCFSACQIEAYGFSKVPGMQVFGQFPTSGVEAEVARGDFKMPEEINMTIPTGRYLFPDGSLFLEGSGVEPTTRVPIDEESVLSGNDTVMQAAVDYILGQ
jgi:C-terminal processing protease CtpA/Prc